MDYLIFAIIAYLIGSTPSALIIGKTFYQIDIREHGSGNLGGTNTFRVLGIKAGIIVSLMDIIKGVIPVLLAISFAPSTHPLIIGIFAVIGHTYPIFAKFKGGKAVATSGGVILAVNPFVFFIALAAFFLFLKLFKYVSLASILTAITAVISSIAFQEVGLTIITVLLASFVIYRHTDNIKRIKNKTEPKITWL
ncbi:glycerol-3-phosphate acyltransferase [Halalkalibacillus sediminis]|uniref:Glycerol-3-phosphate acyltransferase n=1 Tax=Halalkalibacillus sediminis TaxID=2018042 RepID=A0A2I0QWP0_9BACI|nr:glycerol-3-phosphate 1-O-acyltransferase PlsY [Halalkalibacillus sediminis]PKR78734.1 glycerol-3-phosphate acyltransferase [Halalkalibacillus sediminis]